MTTLTKAVATAKWEQLVDANGHTAISTDRKETARGERCTRCDKIDTR